MKEYQIYRYDKEQQKFVPSRTVEANSAWDIELLKGECVFGDGYDTIVCTKKVT